ncbi:MAG: hypothetical protein JW969_06140 [Spirochaetales bacterium]|nr:hypothetical protein [Spirochaetales bacterium]
MNIKARFFLFIIIITFWIGCSTEKGKIVDTIVFRGNIIELLHSDFKWSTDDHKYYQKVKIRLEEIKKGTFVGTDIIVFIELKKEYRGLLFKSDSPEIDKKFVDENEIDGAIDLYEDGNWYLVVHYETMNFIKKNSE